MDYMIKRMGCRGQEQLRRRRRLATMTMAWDVTYFLVSIKVIIDGRLCN